MIGLALCAIIVIAIMVFKKENKNPISKHEKTSFIVGTAAGYAPFVSMNANGEYEGFDIDIAHALAEKMGKNLEIKDLGSMAALFMALEQGSIDAIIWGLSITEDRLKNIAMIHYQGETVTEYPLLFWDSIPNSVTNINDMKNMTISVESSSAQDAALRAYPYIQKQYVDKIDDALLNIQYGKSDAALVEPAIAQKFQAKYPNIKTIPLKLAAHDQVQGIGIAIKKENNQLIKDVQSTVDTLREEGIPQKLEIQWGIA